MQQMQMAAQAGTVMEVDINGLVLAVVESDSRRNTFTQNLKIAVIKQPVGYQVNATSMDAGSARKSCPSRLLRRRLHPALVPKQVSKMVRLAQTLTGPVESR